MTSTDTVIWIKHLDSQQRAQIIGTYEDEVFVRLCGTGECKKITEQDILGVEVTPRITVWVKRT